MESLTVTSVPVVITLHSLQNMLQAGTLTVIKFAGNITISEERERRVGEISPYAAED